MITSARSPPLRGSVRPLAARRNPREADAIPRVVFPCDARRRRVRKEERGIDRGTALRGQMPTSDRRQPAADATAPEMRADDGDAIGFQDPSATECEQADAEDG